MSPSLPAVPASLASLTPFVAAGILGAAEIAATDAAGRRFGEHNPDVLLAYALAVRAPVWGHVCVDLATAADTVIIEDQSVELAWPEPATWIESAATSKVVRRIDEPEQDGLRRWPLVLNGSRLYLDRYAQYEGMVADSLLGRVGGIDDAVTQGVVDRFFGSDPDDRQRQAAEAALTRRLAIILGGPGTGKTWTVARLIAAAMTDGRELGRPLEIALAAPTGKAAARMTEAVRAELTDLGLEPPEATTVHRLLGSVGRRFRHNATNPLPHDLVVIDETSMVSLPLMARLLDALRPTTRLVLVGDPYQLASVEAGAVLGDLTATLESNALASGIVTLERVRRYGDESGIAQLADAIRLGDADRALSILSDDGPGDVRRVDPTDRSALTRLTRSASDSAAAAVLLAREGDHAAALAEASRLKVLAATHRGHLGVADWTDLITERLGEAIDPADRYHPWYVGRPIMATTNDYLNQVYNGDVGLVVADGNDRLVALPGPDGVRLLPVSLLGSVQTWWAMTIHKSQGSEFDAVILSLPPDGSLVLTRELLYTGVTRARSEVTLVATEDSVRLAISRLLQRTSGLSQRLRADVSPG